MATKMNTKFDESNFTSLQDIQIDGHNCCHSVARSHSTKNASLRFSNPSYKTKTKVKDKGIKLTHHNSLNSLNNSLQDPYIRINSQKIFKNSELKMKKIKSSEDPKQSHQSPSVKLFVTKKCIDYKNKKVKQHREPFQLNVRPYLQVEKQPDISPKKYQLDLNVEHEEASSFILTAKKTEANISTERNTPRNLQLSSDVRFPSCGPSMIVRQVEEISFTSAESEIFQAQSRQHFGLKVNKSQKTLQKLYQKKQGRKMEVLESQLSQASDVDLVSIAQSFDWRQKF